MLSCTKSGGKYEMSPVNSKLGSTETEPIWRSKIRPRIVTMQYRHNTETTNMDETYVCMYIYTGRRTPLVLCMYIDADRANMCCDVYAKSFKASISNVYTENGIYGGIGYKRLLNRCLPIHQRNATLS